MGLLDVMKRRRTPPVKPPEGVKLDGPSLAAFNFGVLGHLPGSPEGSFYYDANAVGNVESRMPTPWPNWQDPDWARAFFAAAGGSRAAHDLLFGQPTQARQEAEDE
jgi:hypothetical protein